MPDQTLPVTYFGEPGPQHTAATFELARARARDLGLGQVVVASDSGKTARQALDFFHPELKVTVVTNPAGLQLPVAKLHDYLPRFREHKAGLIADGVTKVPCSLTDEQIDTLTQAGSQVLRIDWGRLQAYTGAGLMALDRIGVAVRVGLTIAVWACLAEAIPQDTEVLSLAGTGFGGGGADTALVVRTAAAWRDWRILETLARPRVSPPSER